LSTTSRAWPGAPNWRRTSPYRTAMVSALLVAADAAPPTTTRPRTSVPSIVKNRRVSFSIELVYEPSGATWPYRSSSISRGTGTWSNERRPLSTPSSPALCPSSPIVTPGIGSPFASRIGTSHACTPYLWPPVTSWAKTTAIRPSRAALPM
jgi:hypothetical protein